MTVGGREYEFAYKLRVRFLKANTYPPKLVNNGWILMI